MTDAATPQAQDLHAGDARYQFDLPPMGLNPSTTAQGTTPGSFANKPKIRRGRAGARLWDAHWLLFAAGRCALWFATPE